MTEANPQPALTLYEQLIIGYMPMKLYISTNYFKINRLGYFFL